MNLSPSQTLLSDFLHVTAEHSGGGKVRSRRPFDPCRRQKSRCEIAGNPPCLLCRFHRQECTFNEVPQPRKRRAVATLEEDYPAEPGEVQKSPDIGRHGNSRSQGAP